MLDHKFDFQAQDLDYSQEWLVNTKPGGPSYSFVIDTALCLVAVSLSDWLLKVIPVICRVDLECAWINWFIPKKSKKHM